MSCENDINAFRMWALKLGCPPEAMPSEEGLKTIFKSRQRSLFCKLMECVQPRQDVAAVRENILIKTVETQKDQLVTLRSRNTLPKEMQNLLVINDLNTTKSEAEARLQKYKRDYQTLAASIKAKSIQNVRLEHKHATQQAKVIVLTFKSESLDQQILKEEQKKAQIIATMPVRLAMKNASEPAALKAVEDVLLELGTFYDLHMNSNNPLIIQDAKDVLWQKIRTIFKDIPNFLIFNSIMRHKEEQLQHIIQLNKQHANDTQLDTLDSAKSKQQALSSFEVKLMKTKGDLLGLVSNFIAAEQNCKEIEENFSSLYCAFAEELERKVHLFNPNCGEEIDETMTEYLVQYNYRNYSKRQNEFLTQQIEFYKELVAKGAKQLENHELLLGSIKQVYSDINASVNRMQYEMLQLNQIKDKIAYSKNQLKNILDDLQATKMKREMKSSFLNGQMSILGTDSFEIGGDNVFCSTQFDFDATTSSLNSTVCSKRRSLGAGDHTVVPLAEVHHAVPPHSMEISIFAEVPFDAFSSFPKECSFYVSPNPLITESAELSSTILLSPGVLLTPFGIMQEVRERIRWANAIAKHSNQLKVDVDLIMVDAQSLKQKQVAQCEHITKLLDDIEVNHINTNRKLQRTKRLYQLILENPFGRHIPPNKRFNNLTYADYESEYRTYYSIVTAGASTK